MQKSNAPYPKSTFIKGIEFDWDSRIRLGDGSDNWPLTWADDDNQYTSFGDGGGFGGSNYDGRASFGFARVEGTKDNFKGINVWGGKDAENPVQFGGKCWGIICIDGTIYMWRSGAGSDDCYAFHRLYKSNNYCATWEDTGVEFHIGSFKNSYGIFVPTFLQFGKDYSGARDNYVYIYAPDVKITEWALQQPGEISLLRVPKDKLEQRDKYEFYCGLDKDNNPTWTADGDLRKPVFSDPNGVMRTSAIYNPGLKRYFLITQHTKRNYGWGIYEAPEPWGPWSTVLYVDEFSPYECKLISYMNFSPKWWGDNGKSFVLNFTGREYCDAWNTIEGKFILE